MDDELSMDEVRVIRLRSQRLHPETSATAVREAVAGICGVQAQDQQAAGLAVRARSQGLTASHVTTALFKDRSIVRTWCIRGSLHLLATTDVSWILSVFGPVFVARSRRRLSNLGFDDEACEQAMNEIESSLAAHGPLTCTEIATSLQEAGIKIDLDSQAPYHLIRRAALLGILCEVAPKDGAESYDLLDKWVSLDDPPDRETALSELARRYLKAYQPATIEDFASWSKLPMRDVRKAWGLINADTTTISIEGKAATVLTDNFPVETDSDSVILRLLPAYDTYVLGYDGREHTVPAEYDSRVWPGGGIIHPIVTLNGHTIGTWKLVRSQKSPSIQVELFAQLDSELESYLQAEIDDISHYLDADIEYQLTSK